MTLGNTPYSIVVDLATMRLTVYEQGTPIMEWSPSAPGPGTDH